MQAKSRTIENKMIRDADELRTMNTTIPPVRTSPENDRPGRVPTANARTSFGSPLLARTVSCPGNWILHLTDTHFALGKFRKQHRWKLGHETESTESTMFEAIDRALEKENRAIGAVLITGDLTFVGSDEEFEVARSEISGFVEGKLGLNLECLVVTPGNHDESWTKGAVKYEQGAEVKLAPIAATRAYSVFYRNLLGHDPNDDLSMSRRWEFPGGHRVEIVAVNSCSLEQGEHFLPGLGQVQEAAYRRASSSLAWGSDDRPSVRILALHHHLVPVEGREPVDDFTRGFGIAADALNIQRMAVRDGVNIAVHGHKHRPAIWYNEVYEALELTHRRYHIGPLNIVGGGSAGSTSTRDGCNYFNLIRVDDTQVTVEMYRSEHGGEFGRFMTWTADRKPVEGSKRTVLSRWQEVDS